MDEIESNPILARLRASILSKNNPKGNNLSNLSTNKILQNITTTNPSKVLETPNRAKESRETPENNDKINRIYKPPIRSNSNAKPNKNISTNTSSTRDSFILPNQSQLQRQQNSQLKGINQNIDDDDIFSAKTYNIKDNPNNRPRLSASTNRYTNAGNVDNNMINGKVKDLAAEFEDLLSKDIENDLNYKTDYYNDQQSMHKNHSNSNFSTYNYNHNNKNINTNFNQAMPSNGINKFRLPNSSSNYARSRSPDRYATNSMTPYQFQNKTQTKDDLVNFANDETDYNININSNGQYQNYNSNAFYSSQSYKKSSNYVINLEDIMLLEEKLNDIIINLSENRPAINESFEWWNFYFNCSLCGKFEYYFKEDAERNQIKDYALIELLAIIICYDSSNDKHLLNTIQPLLKSVILLLQQNFLIICIYILSKVAIESMGNLWVQKLRNLTEKKLLSKDNPNNKANIPNKTFYLLSYAMEIKSNNRSIQDYLRIILKNYPQRQEKTDHMIYYFKNLNKIKIETLNDFFRSKIIRVLNKNASVLASSLFNKDGMYTDNTVPVPFLKNESVKNLTLVLDLDETLIHFKLDEKDDNKGLLRLRPGLFEFLDAIEKYYELVIFTAGTPEVRLFILSIISMLILYLMPLNNLSYILTTGYIDNMLLL